MRLKYYQKLVSTSNEAKELIKNGLLEHGDVIVALQQTGGRGTRGRSFFSPSGGLYASIVLKKDTIKLLNPTAITALAGVCVCETIEKFTNKKPMIKWVNDVYIQCTEHNAQCTINNEGLIDADDVLPPLDCLVLKKVCGILTEVADDKYILGIGINFGTKDFDNELKKIATGLGDDIDKDEFLRCLVPKILSSTLTQAQIFDSYRQRLIGIGRAIEIEGDTGTMQGVDDSGALLLDINGKTKTIYAGSIRFL